MGEFLFVNSVRLRMELDNYAAFSAVLGIFREFGIGALRMDEGAERREWQALLSLFVAHRTLRGLPPQPTTQKP